MFSEVLNKYNSIDTKKGTDKITSHSYNEIYDKLFSQYKDVVENILEIGIDGGYALQAYSEYFQNAHIYGIDIADNTQSFIKHNNNIHLCFGDAKDSSVINKFGKFYDIIIEDASHLPEDQIQHFKDYSKFVKPGGVYIIEDVNEKYLETVLNETSKYANNNEFQVQLVDLRHIKNRFDDILIIFKKKECVN